MYFAVGLFGDDLLASGMFKTGDFAIEIVIEKAMKGWFLLMVGC